MNIIVDSTFNSNSNSDSDSSYHILYKRYPGSYNDNTMMIHSR